MEEKVMLRQYDLSENRKKYMSTRPKKEREVKDKIELEIEMFLEEILQKLPPEHRKNLLEILDSRLYKDIKPRDKKLKSEVLRKDHPKLPVLQLLKDTQNAELSIELCVSKKELIELLNYINAFLLENYKKDYHIKVKKIEKRK